MEGRNVELYCIVYREDRSDVNHFALFSETGEVGVFMEKIEDADCCTIIYAGAWTTAVPALVGRFTCPCCGCSTIAPREEGCDWDGEHYLCPNEDCDGQELEVS